MSSPLPKPAQRTLVLIADDDEAVDLIPADTKPIWTVPESGAANPQQAFEFENLVVVVTGSGGPAIGAVGARFLARALAGEPFRQVVNFGSCGRYPWSETELCGAYFVRASRPWDLSFNFRGWEYFNGEFELALPPKVAAANASVCFSGGRYTTPTDRQWPMFLEADFEEYELYTLSWLCAELAVPLTGIKFVTDDVAGAAVASKGSNLPQARAAGTRLLVRYLAGEFGWPDAPPRHAGA